MNDDRTQRAGLDDQGADLDSQRAGRDNQGASRDDQGADLDNQRAGRDGEAAGLEKAIRLPHATAMVVGTIVGASIFVQPSEVTGLIPSVPGVLLVWLASGVLTLFGALVCAELASIYTETGGVYVYLRESISPALGFLWGWAMFWTMHSGIIAVVAVVFARYVGFFMPLGPSATNGVAVAGILALSVVNVFGVKHGTLLQTAFTLGKLLAIVLMIAVGFSLGSPPEATAAVAEVATGSVTVGNFALAMVAGLFAFGGWHMVTYNAGETVEPRKTIPRALMIGTAIVTVCYLALNSVYLYVLPLEKVASSTRVAADAADAVLGFGGGAAMSALVIFSTFGALSGIVLAGPRVYYAMSRDGNLVRWFGDLHPRFHTPHRAIMAQGIWASVLVVTGKYRDLFTRVVYTEWIFFGLMAIGLMLLRRRSEVRREYSMWGYPFTPVIFIISAFAIVANQLASEPVHGLQGLAMILVGVPVYLIWGGKRPQPDPSQP